jgi:hypothetical protein
MPRIFLSYRRDDSEDITGRIHDHLKAHFGGDAVFMDIVAIPLGVDFRRHLETAVSQCDILLAVIGEDWVNIRHREGPKAGERRLDDPGDFVRIEVQTALDRGIPVIPVLVARATMPALEALPPELGQLAYQMAAEVRSGRDFTGHVERLIRGIEQLTRPHSASKPREPEQPTASASRNAADDPSGPDFRGHVDRLIRGFSSFTKSGKPATAGQPGVIEIPVPGVWSARPAGDDSAEWREVARTPARVSPDPGQDYSLAVEKLHSSNERKQLRHILVQLRGLTSLRSLAIHFSVLMEEELAHIKVLTSLRSLDLYGSSVEDAGLVQLKNLAGLQVLRLGLTDVTEAGLSHLQGLSRLRELNLTHSKQLTDAWLAHVRDFPALHSLGLGMCDNLTDAGLVHLKGLTSLHELELGFTPITDTGLARLTSLSGLWTLGLQGCRQLTDAGVAHLKALPGLRHLNLQFVPVTDAGLSDLAVHTSLQFLCLSDCQRITDAGLAHLKGLTALRKLRLRRTAVTDAGLAHLQGLTSLQQLELIGTAVTPAGVASLQRAIPDCVIQHDLARANP